MKEEERKQLTQVHKDALWLAINYFIRKYPRHIENEYLREARVILNL